MPNLFIFYDEMSFRAIVCPNKYRENFGNLIKLFFYCSMGQMNRKFVKDLQKTKFWESKWTAFRIFWVIYFIGILFFMIFKTNNSKLYYSSHSYATIVHLYVRFSIVRFSIVRFSIMRLRQWRLCEKSAFEFAQMSVRFCPMR